MKLMKAEADDFVFDSETRESTGEPLKNLGANVIRLIASKLETILRNTSALIDPNEECFRTTLDENSKKPKALIHQIKNLGETADAPTVLPLWGKVVDETKASSVSRSASPFFRAPLYGLRPLSHSCSSVCVLVCPCVCLCLFLCLCLCLCVSLCVCVGVSE